MKTIYLQDECYNWQQFQYENIDQLKCEFENRKIQIGSGCKIDSDCNIGYGCKIGSGCNIDSDCNIGSGCKIGYGCKIDSDCNIDYGCKIGSGCNIDSDCKIGSGCKIDSGCCLGKIAKVEEKIFLLKNIYIIGSKHSVTYVGNRNVSIGCHTYSIDTWLRSENIGKKEGYTPEQIEEYRQYIIICDAFDKAIK